MNVTSFCRPAVVVLGMAVFLGGCSAFFGEEGVFRSRQKDYLRAGQIKPIELPAGMQSAPLTPLFVIPEITARDEFGDPYQLVDYEVPLPEAMADKGEVGVKIQKLKDDRWIFLNASTAQVWPRTQNFMSEYGLNVVESNARAGLIETSWIRFRDDATMKSRYRVFLEKGIHPDTSEIHILQIERPESYPEDQPVTWPAQSDNKEREGWLLEELAGVLAESVDNNAASLLGQNVGGESKVGFVDNALEPTLRLRLSNERAWGTLAHALNKEGFVLWTSDTDLGVFYVGYSKYSEEKRGFFSRLAFWRDRYVAPKEPPYPLAEVATHLSPKAGSLLALKGFAAGDALPKGDGYLVLLIQSDKAVDVVLRDHRGMPLPLNQSKELLRLIRKNLI